jgi:DNA-binding helix-hairpin-helix protein with protein kinase domain
MATTDPVSPFYDSRGIPVRLGKRIGSGGEGDVYEILSSPQATVAKIYKKPLDLHKQEKLRLMARGCNDELEAISAWPSDVLSKKPGGPVVGFIMPRILDAEPIHKVYGPTHRKETFPHADWRFLVRAAKNLAAAFCVIHKYGYVVGDVNEGNILVNDTACVRLIDCDSFQVRSKDQLYCCEVGVAHFTPPEIQKTDTYRLDRTQNQDNFGLAVLIFQLLFLGRHPYAGVYSGREDMPIEKAIAEFRFPYGKNARQRMMAPPPNSVGLNSVPDAIASLFERAFAEAGMRNNGRPTAEEWWDVLDPFEGKLRRCGSDGVHYYYSGLSSCPWCRLEEASGVLIFLSADSITKIDLRREWQKVQAISAPGTLPAITPEAYYVRTASLDPAIQRSLEFRKFRQLAGITLAIACLVLAIGELVTDPLLILVLGLIAIALFFLPGKEDAERRKRWSHLETAEYMWKLWNRKWTEEAGEGAFNAQLNRLRELRHTYEKIDHEFQRGVMALEKTVRDGQISGFLERYAIASGSLSRINPAQMASLKTTGIVTAADVTPGKLRRVHELDPKIAGELISWRERLEKAFLFDPGKGVSRSEIRALVHKYQPQIRPVEAELVQGIHRLARIREDVVKKRLTLRAPVEKRARELAQAKADYRPFESDVEDAIRKDLQKIANSPLFSR